MSRFSNNTFFVRDNTLKESMLNVKQTVLEQIISMRSVMFLLVRTN